jgi:hypothetical protein
MQRLIQPNRNAAMAQSEAFTNYKEKLSKVINFAKPSLNNNQVPDSIATMDAKI